MSAFFYKKQHFLAKVLPLLKAIVWELCKRFWEQNQKKTMTSQFADMAWSPTFFDVVFVFLAKFLSVQVLCQCHDWFWGYNNFCLSRIDRKFGNRKYPRLCFANIWRLGRVRDTKFSTNVFNKMLLDAAKCQSFSFYRLWFIKGKLTAE